MQVLLPPSGRQDKGQGNISSLLPCATREVMEEAGDVSLGGLRKVLLVTHLLRLPLKQGFLFCLCLSRLEIQEKLVNN